MLEDNGGQPETTAHCEKHRDTTIVHENPAGLKTKHRTVKGQQGFSAEVSLRFYVVQHV